MYWLATRPHADNTRISIYLPVDIINIISQNYTLWDSLTNLFFRRLISAAVEVLRFVVLRFVVFLFFLVAFLVEDVFLRFAVTERICVADALALPSLFFVYLIEYVRILFLRYK